ncbi:hypothetical protein [Aurantimonas sp. Leaf443]|uniref:hypothetical protein n=1 Tax=Aurantimonas sp. Leaf443 TaxID=1736378 RepID=UPI00070097BB|nr:hypothetical protein [Aurantimonas sp. Leaf443]KQT85383.1 hypothetical protein ASG48_09105 [Aurantimonas sp. Leaf443]
MDPSRTPDELKDTPSKAPGRAEPQQTGGPAAGPHARPDLTNEEATPGAGSLPQKGGGDADGGAG